MGNEERREPLFDWDRIERINFPEVAHKPGEHSLEAIERGIYELLDVKVESGEITQEYCDEVKAYMERIISGQDNQVEDSS